MRNLPWICLLLALATCILFCQRKPSTPQEAAHQAAIKLAEKGASGFEGPPDFLLIDRKHADPWSGGVLARETARFKLAQKEDPKAVLPIALEAVQHLSTADDDEQLALALAVLIDAATTANQMKPEWLTQATDVLGDRIALAISSRSEDEGRGAVEVATALRKYFEVNQEYALKEARLGEAIPIARRLELCSDVSIAKNMLAKSDLFYVFAMAELRHGQQRRAAHWAELGLRNPASPNPAEILASKYFFGSVFVRSDPQKVLDETETYLDDFGRIEKPDVNSVNKLSDLCGIRAVCHLILGNREDAAAELEKRDRTTKLKPAKDVEARFGTFRLVAADTTGMAAAQLQATGYSANVATNPDSELPEIVVISDLFRKGQFEAALKRADRLLKRLPKDHWVLPVVLDLKLESAFEVHRPAKELIALVHETTSAYWASWRRGDTSTAANGRFQEAFANPFTRAAYILESTGDSTGALLMLDSGRAWAVARKDRGNELSSSIGPAVPPIGEYVKWIRTENKLHPTIAVCFSICEERPPMAFCLTSGGVKPIRLNGSYAAIQSAVNRWMALVSQQGSSFDQEIRASKELYDLCLAPLQGLLPTSEGRLIVVPDGPLRKIPFAALSRDGKADRLIERSSVAVTPALHLLLNLKKEAKRTRASGFIGAPKISHDSLPPLDGFADLIRRLTKNQTHAPLLGPDCLKSKVKGLLPKVTEIAFLTHGMVDPKNPLDSYLLLGGAQGRAQQLSLREILRLRLNSDIVALWCCETAVGPEGGGEGNIDLAWAFLAGGAKSVIASKWNVSESATVQLAEEFYFHEWAAGTPKDVALQKAILETRKDPKFAHPYFWAAFDLYNDYSPLVSSAAATQ